MASLGYILFPKLTLEGEKLQLSWNIPSQLWSAPVSRGNGSHGGERAAGSCVAEARPAVGSRGWSTSRTLAQTAEEVWKECWKGVRARVRMGPRARPLTP